jgi:hypothetical protein
LPTIAAPPSPASNGKQAQKIRQPVSNKKGTNNSRPFCALLSARDTGHFLGYVGAFGTAAALTATGVADSAEAGTVVGAPATVPTTLGGFASAAGFGTLSLAGTGLEYTARGLIALQTGNFGDLGRSGVRDALTTVGTTAANALAEGHLAPIKDILSMAASDALSKNESNACR